MAEGKATVDANGGLNVRQKASKDSKKLGTLSNGTTVDYYSDNSGWLQIKYSGKTGYIMKSYTHTTGGATGAQGSSKGDTNVKFDVDKAVEYNKKRNYSKDLWKQIQSKAGATADGAPGKETAKAIAQWQGSHGLTADGMCGAGTLQAMGLSSSTATESSSKKEDGKTSSGSANVSIDVSSAVEFNNSLNYTSDTWKKIQAKVSVHADGDPGPNTANAIAIWQNKNGLKADGKCGDKTLAKMGIKAKTKTSSNPSSYSTTDVPKGNITAHFTWDQFKCKGGEAVPSNLRDGTRRLCQNLEVVREELGGKPIKIVCGYRSKAYNEKLREKDPVGVAKHSKHMDGIAADIRIEGVKVEKIYNTIYQLGKSGKIKKGGLGKYVSSNFVHYDVRGGSSWTTW